MFHFLVFKMVIFEKVKVLDLEYQKFIQQSFDENGLKCYFDSDDDRYLEVHTKKFVPFNSLVGKFSSHPTFIKRPSNLEIELVNEKYKDSVIKAGELIEEKYKSNVRVTVYE